MKKGEFMNQPQVELLATWGIPEGGSGDNAFRQPEALATDSAGNLIVADTGNHRILKLDPNGNLIWKIGGIDNAGQPWAGTAMAEFNGPRAICTDNENNVYVCDTLNCRVQKFDADGNQLLIFGTQGPGYGQFGGQGPQGIAIDENGYMLVSDTHTSIGGNHRVQKLDQNGHFVTQFGSYGTGLGQFGGAAPIREYGLDFGPGIGPGPIGPAGIVVNKGAQHISDRNNWGADIFVADCDNDRLQIFKGIGLSDGSFGDGIVFRPRQLSMDGSGRLYVSGVHKHEPPMETSDLTDPLKWRVVAESRWVWVFDVGSKLLIGQIGTTEAHDQMAHHYGAGLHCHGYGLSVSKADDSIVYIQGDNLIFKYQVTW